MGQIFWESTQRARKEYRCDRCFEFIQPGQEYTREMWAPQKGRWYVVRSHSDPACPRAEFDMSEDMVLAEVMTHTEIAAEIAAPLVSIQYELRTARVVVLQHNGSSTTIETTEMVPILVSETREDADDDIPF